MDNSVFCKTQENLRKRVNVELIPDANILRKHVANPIFCRGMPITECLTVVQTTLATLTFNLPIYIEFTVLELSKLHIYYFHYNYMKVKYPHSNQLRLLFTDTDSLACAVQTDDIYEDMTVDASGRYDFSEYPFCSASNWKGVKRKVKEDHLRFGHYLDVLHSFESYVCKQNLISSSAHTVRTAHSRKVGLTAFDTKRWLYDDTIHTHSYGHRDTVANPLELENPSFITKCIAQTGIYGPHGPPSVKSDHDSDYDDNDWSGWSD